MIIESVATSIAIGKIRKRKIINIGLIEIKRWYLFTIAFTMEVSSNIIVTLNESKFTNLFINYFFLVHFFSYILLFIGIYNNRNKLSMRFIFIGTFLNFICIMANDGHMPIWFDGLKLAGLIKSNAATSTLDLTHILLSNDTKLKFLADIIPLPKPYPFAKIISLGDLILGIGVFIFIQDAMKDKRYIP